MNIRGVELLRQYGLPGPRKSMIGMHPEKFDLDYLYKGATYGATLIACDYREPINQLAIFEKDVHRYQIRREDFFDIPELLSFELSKKGVDKKDMKFFACQTFTHDNILYSGRIAVLMEPDGIGRIVIDAIDSNRKPHADFSPTFLYSCPIVGGRIFYSEEQVLKSQFMLPDAVKRRVIRDAWTIPCNPTLDFHAYADTGDLFYFDLFLAGLKP
jgi:hypothetical protein